MSSAARRGDPDANGRSRSCPPCAAPSDDAADFDATRHPLIADAHHRNPGLRLSRTGLVFDALVSAIFEQKVTGMQAFAAWRRVVTWCGERAPGPTPAPMFAPPTVDGWQHVPSWVWHRAGLEPPQSKTIVRAARRGDAIVRTVLAAEDGEAVDRVLVSQHGVGPWTSAETRIRALGDPDAVSVGDYHVAHEVGLRADRPPRRRRWDAAAPGGLAGPAAAGDQADRSERRARAPPWAAPAPRGSPRPLSRRTWIRICRGASGTFDAASPDVPCGCRRPGRHWDPPRGRARHPSTRSRSSTCPASTRTCRSRTKPARR